jgi:predicted lipid-binding transport protein (Tim44 family)
MLVFRARLHRADERAALGVLFALGLSPRAAWPAVARSGDREVSAALAGALIGALLAGVLTGAAVFLLVAARGLLLVLAVFRLVVLALLIVPCRVVRKVQAILRD